MVSFRLGSFLDEMGKSRQAREIRQAELADAERERLAEIAKEERAYNRSLMKEAALLKMREPYEIAKEERTFKNQKSMKKIEHDYRFAEKNYDSVFSTIKDIAKNGSIPTHIKQMYGPKQLGGLGYFSLPQYALFEEGGRATLTGEVKKEDRAAFNDLNKGIMSKGSITSLISGQFMYRKFGHLFNDRKDFNQWFTKAEKQVGINAQKASTSNTPKPPKHTTRKFNNSKGEEITFSPRYQTKGVKRDAQLNSHNSHVTTTIAHIQELIGKGKLDPVKDRKLIENILNEEVKVRNNFLPEQLDDYTELTQYKKSNLPQIFNDSELKRKSDKPPIIGAADSEGKVEEPVSPSESEIVTDDKVPENVLDSPKEPEQERDDDDVLNNPRRIGKEAKRLPFFTPFDPIKGKEGLYYLNESAKNYDPQSMVGYLTANHERIDLALTNKYGVDYDPVNNKEATYKFFTTGGGKEHKKAYLTSVVSKAFQKYAKDPNDNYARIALSEDENFHKHLYELEKTDSRFNSNLALAEAVFQTLPTHKYDTRLSKDSLGGRKRPLMNRKFFFHKYSEKDPTQIVQIDAAFTKFKTKKMSAEESLRALDSTIDLIGSGKDLGGVAAEVRTKIETYVGIGRSALSQIKGILTSDEKNERLDANRKALSVFQEKADKELQDLESLQGDNKNSIEYLKRSELLQAKIKLAYSLSAQLQGDGTGGGRTISDADFQYALQAVWGGTPQQIKIRLESLKNDLQGKLRRYEMYFNFDESGLSRGIADFIGTGQSRGYDKYYQTRQLNERRILIAQDQENLTKQSIPRADDTPKEFASKLHDRINSVHTGDNPSGHFNTLFSRDNKKYITQVNVLSDIIQQYIQKDPSIISIAEQYKEVKKQNAELPLASFYENMRETNTAFKDSTRTIRRRLAASFFSNLDPKMSLIKTDGKMMTIGTGDEIGVKLFPLKTFDEGTQSQNENLMSFLILTAIDGLV